MTFHIGQQNAGIVNNVGRDQHNRGGQHATVVVGADIVRALGDLRAALTAAPLPPEVVQEAVRQLDQAEDATRGAEPDQPRVASALERLTRLLVAAGPVAAATNALAGPLLVLGRWLGPLGEGLLRMLPAL